MSIPETRVERNNKSVIDYIMANEVIYQYHEYLEINKVKMIYI